MAQHFLLSARARTLTIASILRMSDRDAEAMFASIRWSDTGGKAVCPHCGCPTCYEARRPNGSLRYRCKACRKDFSLTSGTLFAHHKMPLQTYLAAIVIFCNEVKGKSALALSRDLGVQYKTSWVLAHKLREAMATEMKGSRLGGKGEVVEIDGGYFGGYVKPANRKEDRKDRRLAVNQTGKRKCVVVIRQRDSLTLPTAFPSEAAALSFIRSRVAAETEIHADEASSWDALHAHYVVKRINHQVAYSLDGTHTNGAESFFSRMRRGEIGHHHHIAGTYLVRYAQEAGWREDHRRDPNGAQVKRVVGLAMMAGPSVDFCGYWQRAMVNGPSVIPQT
ncbi:IS1595 family transposase [Roseicella sp. DB1501]|uniref:IS1595 family transposase n=1 Tax=Roseicella sp. DB1501 TaxID=2730925 RepID=UPI001492EE5C|nr:IS1595 family transposase [Roseicella sp. DB1501]NOG72666.1 IS1595 family transposase [Roseicella sp. DB1501]